MREQRPSLREMTAAYEVEAAAIRAGGGQEAIERQHGKGRLTARERIKRLLDGDSTWLELGLWAAYGMYSEHGGAPAAGVVTGIGVVSGRRVMVVANDATVKAGACFPMTIKKILRAQAIAWENRLPLVYLVDSSGVFLPMQDEVFPDADDFGRIFRNNAVISAAGVPQLAAIMGNCVAGGAYLPVLCDTLLMTEGSGLYLAGPALVKAAIGQDISSEELGGVGMHAIYSGTVDFREKDDESCLERLRSLIGFLAPDPAVVVERIPAREAARAGTDLYEIVHTETSGQYDVRDVLACLVDGGSFQEFRAEYGAALVCGFARMGGIPLGIVANQRLRMKPASGGAMQFGGVIYADSADKAARFVLECDQMGTPLLFLQDVNGFDVGRDAERTGIIRRGAKLVSAVSNARVAKITLLMGHSFGAGHYALAGRAFDPAFVFAWPGARYAVMGAAQAARTMLDVQLGVLRRAGRTPDDRELERLTQELKARYERETEIRYGAARLWVDAILDPAETRGVLIEAFDLVTRRRPAHPMATGVFQV